MDKNISAWFSGANWLLAEPDVASSKLRLSSDSELIIKSLFCLRKNEQSTDEVRLTALRCTRRGEIIGQVQQKIDFREAGERREVGLRFHIGDLLDGHIFYIFVYEEDTPPIDPHDPIGVIAFFGNQGIAIYEGDFRKPLAAKKRSMNFDKSVDIDLDAGPKGHYAVEVRVVE